MVLELADCRFFGPALPEPFVKFELEDHLEKAKLLRKSTGPESKQLADGWDSLRKKLRLLGEHGGAARVANHVIAPLAERLGYARVEGSQDVATREGQEDGGWLLSSPQGALRAWATDLGTDLDAPSRRGRAYRFSPTRIAQRVLLATNERIGLLTDGAELRILLCDPARPDSQISVRLDRADGGWRAAKSPPDSYRLLLALCSPAGVAQVHDLTEKARLSQSRVTKKLREQAKRAVVDFVQEVLADPANDEVVAQTPDRGALAQKCWAEALIVVYRLLFILKLESSPDPARAFSFASTSLWRRSFSPNTALAPVVRAVRDHGAETGRMLGDGLRSVFRLFQEGLHSSELRVNPLGGMLFGPDAAPFMEAVHWPERAVAALLDNLLWTPGGKRVERERVHYGSLDVEDLGRVYEALLELEPGIAGEPMCRLRRQKLEVVVPLAQGAQYRSSIGSTSEVAGDEDGAEDDEEESAAGAVKSRVTWIEEIPTGQFFLRAGLGRKSTGSYYTPHAFVRFLVQETLESQIAGRSSPNDPNPAAILRLNVLDPAMGSGHFLVEACRYLGEKLYEACRLCDERASAEEELATKTKTEDARQGHILRAAELRKRVEDLPDPNGELVAYLPSRVPDGENTGISQAKAVALCRRLAAVHCLYGVDKNPLAVELAKVSLWLESYAEGLPLTFLDHRLLAGDSLTGPFFDQLLTYPGTGQSIEELHTRGVTAKLESVLRDSLSHVRDLEASVGKDVADVEHKRAAKALLDEALAPFLLLARTWSGGVMLGSDGCDDAGYEHLLRAIAERDDTEAPRSARPATLAMASRGVLAVPYDLVFPEVFFPTGDPDVRGGFDAVVGNPPWDALQPYAKEFYAAFDLRVLDAPTRKERGEIEKRLASTPEVRLAYEGFALEFAQTKAILDRLCHHVGLQAGGASSGAATDLWQAFAERGFMLLRTRGRLGVVLPSAFHANQSATGIRELYLRQGGRLRSCFSFENRNKLFDIDSRFKFATVVAERDITASDGFDCAFYLHDLEWLFQPTGRLRFDTELIQQTGGDYLTFLEVRSQLDADAAKAAYLGSITCGSLRERWGFRIGEEMHMSKSSHLFTSATKVLRDGEDPREPAVATSLRARGYLPLHEGKTFHQYTDHWEARPRYLVALEDVADKPGWTEASRHFRLAFRDVASATNERTGIFTLLPPGVLCGNKAPCERQPGTRPSQGALIFLAVGDSFPFDFVLRLKVAATVNLFILDGCPIPRSAIEPPRSTFLAHSALRLSCNHEGFSKLWKEQLGPEWREHSRPRTWPVLAEEKTRWSVRAAIDAVVAEAYGLSRDAYVHVLSSFNHKSHPTAAERCLAAFDELTKIGLRRFTKQHDPYWDVPLVETLPRPAIDLVPATAAKAASTTYQKSAQQSFLDAADIAAPSKRRTPSGKKARK